MRTTRPHGVGLPWCEAYLLLRLSEEDLQAAMKDEERVLHARVVVPRHLLARTDLELRDAKARSLGVGCRTLGFVEALRIVAGVHDDPLVRYATRPTLPAIVSTRFLVLRFPRLDPCRRRCPRWRSMTCPTADPLEHEKPRSACAGRRSTCSSAGRGLAIRDWACLRDWLSRQGRAVPR